MKILLTLTALLVPFTTLAAGNGLTIRERAELRAVERLEKLGEQGMRSNFIRLGRHVRTRDMSIRRVRSDSEGVVQQVIDGSLLTVLLGNGYTEVVRLLGAEAPLLDTGSDKEQCFALEAKAALEDLVLGKPVTLERDRNYQWDNYRRLLRYVRLNSLDVNGWMIDNGYAFADDNNTHRRTTNYQLRENEARDYERGLWGDYCEYNPSPSRVFEILQ